VKLSNYSGSRVVRGDDESLEQMLLPAVEHQLINAPMVEVKENKYRRFNVIYSANSIPHTIPLNICEYERARTLLEQNYSFFAHYFGDEPDEIDGISYYRIGKNAEIYVTLWSLKSEISAASQDRQGLRDFLVLELLLPEPSFVNNE
jgi:hypothetical protein